jgi:hypothetical protein
MALTRGASGVGVRVARAAHASRGARPREARARTSVHCLTRKFSKILYKS